jgi:hypothetical protein
MLIRLKMRSRPNRAEVIKKYSSFSSIEGFFTRNFVLFCSN